MEAETKANRQEQEDWGRLESHVGRGILAHSRMRQGLSCDRDVIPSTLCESDNPSATHRRVIRTIIFLRAASTLRSSYMHTRCAFPMHI